jgi:hypothetical protein
MTGPIEGAAPGSDHEPTALPPAGSTIPAPAELADAAPAEPADAAPPPPDLGAGGIPPAAPEASPGWVASGPQSGRRGRGCVIAAIVTAAILLFGFVGVLFLGAQVVEALKGTIEFGTGGTECSVTGEATTFPASATIHLAAHLEREVSAGEVITLRVLKPDGTTETGDTTYDEAATCLYQDVSPGLPSGHYALEFRAGTEVLSRGEMDITP